MADAAQDRQLPATQRRIEKARRDGQVARSRDLGHFALVNEIMAEYFSEPYPARAAVGVAALPKGAQVEMDAVMELDNFDENDYLDQ